MLFLLCEMQIFQQLKDSMAWNQIFNVTVQHSFFSLGENLLMCFFPDKKTEYLLNNASFLFRTDTDSFSVFFNSDNVEIIEAFFEDSEEVIEFTFKVESSDSRFFYYTNQPVNTFPWYENKFSIESVLEKTDIFSKKNINPPAAMITISISKNEIFKNKKYIVRFESKHTYWKYYVVIDHIADDFHIIDLDGDIKFNCAGEKIIFEKIKSVVFYSSKPILLVNRPMRRFQLRQKDEYGGKILINRLKNASAENMSIEVIDNRKEYISEIYVAY